MKTEEGVEITPVSTLPEVTLNIVNFFTRKICKKKKKEKKKKNQREKIGGLKQEFYFFNYNQPCILYWSIP
jgi:hypothetical protein